MVRLLVFLVLLPCITFAQSVGDYRTDQAGNWNAATSWEVFVSGAWQKLENASAGIYQNITPTSLSGAITIQNNTSITASVSVDQLTINSTFTLTIAATRILTIDDGAGDDLINFGTITTTGSLSISPNATYNHSRDGGTIPLASWGSNSTCYVSGITATNPTLIAANSYENFTWDCVQTATRSLAGNLRTVNGNLLILNTNDQQLQFSTGTAFTLNIGGDLTIQGNSRIAFTTTANPVIVNLTGNFDYSSSAVAASNLKSSGIFTFNIGGSFTQSSGTITISTGANSGTINLEGDFTQSSGTLNRTGGTGAVFFNGTGGSQNVTSNGTISSTINFTVTNTSGIILNSDLSLPAALAQNSGAGIIDLNGNTLTINGSLTQTSGSIGVNTASQLILQGSGTLPVGSISFSGTDLLRLEVNQTGTLTTSSSIAITTLNLLNGTLTSTTISIQPGGQITRLGGTITNTPSGSSYNVVYTNTANITTGAELPTSATVLNDLTKQGTGTTTLNQSLVTINGNLTLSAGTFASSTNSISLAGNFVSNAAFTTAAGATFTLVGSTALSGSTAPIFRNLVVNGTLTPAVSYGVNGNYDVGGTGIVNAGSGTVTFAGATVITNNGTLNLNAVTISNTFTMTAPSTTMGIAGNFTSTGTFNNGSGTILFNGTTNLTATEVYNNVTISGTVTSTGNFSQTIAGNLINNNSLNIGTGNLTWSGSGTISGSGSTTVADVNVTGTSCTYTASGNLTLNDDLLGTGSFNSSGSSASVIFAGAGSAINRTGSTTFRDVTVNGTLTPATNYTLVGSGGLTVNGTLVSGATIIFGGTTQTIGGSSNAIAFNNVTTNVGSTVNITPNITINGNLIGNGNIASSATITFVGLTMSGTGTKTFTNVTIGAGTLTPNANYSISGNLVVTGTLAAGNATTTFNGNTTISGAGSATFNFLTIASTSTLTSSSGTINVVRDFTNNGTFNHGNGTVSFSTAGTVQQQILGSSSTVFNNLIINNVGVATDVTNGVTGGATVDIARALSFGEANAVIDADGSGSSILRFLSTSDNTSTDGRVAAITFAGSSISGNITVQRYVSSENRIYRYIASPVVGATVAQLKSAIPVTGTFTDPSNGSSTPPCAGCNTTNPSLFSFNESTNAYVAFPSSGLASANNFANGRGYSAFFRHTGLGAVGIVTINFRGTHPSTAGVALPVSPNALGYSLVGNPYPSPIVWNNGTGWVKTNIGDVIVVRDNATGVHQSHGTVDNFIIAPGQSFWVQSTSAGASLTINENAKTSGNYSFYRLDQPIADQVELALIKSATSVSATAKISMVDGSSVAFDGFDGNSEGFDNFINNGGTNPQVQDIAVVSPDSKLLVVNAIPSISCGQQFLLNVKDMVLSTETVVNYTLSINPTGALKAISWILHDNYLNQDVDLTISPAYQFSVDNSIAASKAANRFVLTASTAVAIDTSKPVTTLPSSTCTISDATLTVQSQAGISYGVEINGIFFPNVAQGNGSDLTISIESDKLVSGTNSIRLKASNGCASGFLTNTISINRVAPYSISQVSNSALCSSGSTTLTASGAPSDAIIRWYDSKTSTNAIATGSDFITPILSDSVTRYFVAASRPDGCEGDRLEAKVEVTNLTDSFSVSQDQATCKSGSVLLQASASLPNGTFKWYETSTSQTPLAEAQDFLINNLQSSREYYVSYTSNTGCESLRVPVTASVIEFNPSIEVNLEKPIVCVGERHIFSASQTPDAVSFEWFDSSVSTTPIATGNKLITNPLASNSDYYLRAVNGLGCASDRMKVTAPVSVGINPLTIDFSATSICREGEATIQSVNGSSSTTYRWYASMNDLNPVHMGTTFTTGSLSTATKFYVTAIDVNGCESNQRKEVGVQVTSYPEPVIQVSGDGSLKSNFAVGNSWYLNGNLLPNETSQLLQVSESGDYSLKVDYQGCSEFSGGVNVTTLITGIEDSSYEYSVFPNPVSDILQIRVKDSAPIMRAYLVNSNGAKVTEIQMNRNLDGWSGEIDLRNASKGLYIIQLNAGERLVAHKIIVR